eukprot:38475-Eustigmatos_ZCMA.PRE.1
MSTAAEALISTCTTSTCPLRAVLMQWRPRICRDFRCCPAAQQLPHEVGVTIVCNMDLQRRDHK